MSSREVLALLSQDGWYLDRTSGSHHQLRHPTKPGTVTVPHPKKDLKPKTLASIEKQSGVRLRKRG
jgi:predicted RNA binding protein YcfA (HicA-like mRNA interferase family)